MQRVCQEEQEEDLVRTVDFSQSSDARLVLSVLLMSCSPLWDWRLHGDRLFIIRFVHPVSVSTLSVESSSSIDLRVPCVGQAVWVDC